MTYLPSPIVTIGSVDFTSNVIGQISISRGRRAVYETVNAGFASIELRDVGDLPSFAIGATVQITIEDSGGDPVKVFTGLLSDISSQTVVTGGEPLVFYRLQCVGPLAQLNRRAVFPNGRVQENDGQRIAAAVLSSGLRWEEVALTLEWDDAEGTWFFFGAPDVSLIDDGLSQIAALPVSSSRYNTLNVIQNASLDADGFLFESADGLVGYQNGDRRRERQNSTFAPFPADALDVEGFSVIQQLADITNRATVEFAGGTESASDAVSVTTFGLYESSIGTNLVMSQDAQTRAFERILRQSQPHSIVERLPFNLLSLSDSVRDAVLDVEQNDAVAITDVPARLGFTEFEGFVEGITLQITPFKASVVWNVSDRALSVAIPSSGGFLRLFFDGLDLYALHEFTSAGDFRLFDEREVEYLIVGGGGGGGGGDTSVVPIGNIFESAQVRSAGGGGAGGAIFDTDTLAAGVYPVTVGLGGAGGTSAPGTVGADGGNSTFLALVATGGGGGGKGELSVAGADGENGGSGGGGGSANVTAGSGGLGVAGQGNDGGDGTAGFNFQTAGGGGGGATSVGQDGVGGALPIGGDAGDGVVVSITGSPVAYAGGGGGAPSGAGGDGGGGAGGVAFTFDAAGQDATGSGSGGGGAAHYVVGDGPFGLPGGSGSDGVVFIRYKV